MSKKRPRESSAQARFGMTALEPAPKASGWWRPRVYKNTYTFKGRRVQVKGWHVKIQHQQRRRTFSIAAKTRAEAALEAEAIYQTILTRGWPAAILAHAHQHGRTRRPARGHAGGLAANTTSGYASADDWKLRLIQRKYTELARLVPGNELSTRVEHNGVYHYFPLDTADETKAAAKAKSIFHHVVNHGWESTRERYRREITIGMFWSNSPIACTYATIFTLPGAPARTSATPSAESRARGTVCLIEPEAGVRAALSFWLDRHADWRCAAAFRNEQEALALIARQAPDLLLINRSVMATSGETLPAKLCARLPKLALFSYGIYDDSDQFFLSLAGVPAGYLLRRAKPAELLAPLCEAASQKAFPARPVFHRIRDYFQSFFAASAAPRQTLTAKPLTVREHEILSCVSKGYLDKEIADQLKISVWTVHNHLKNIYEKLQVHSRTEAAVKYLQK